MSPPASHARALTRPTAGTPRPAVSHGPTVRVAHRGALHSLLNGLLAAGVAAALAACDTDPAGPVSPAAGRRPVLTAATTSAPSSQQVGAGDGYSCALRYDGAAQCWGTGQDAIEPTVKVPATGRFVRISTGYTDACALRSDGVVECLASRSEGGRTTTRTATSGTFAQVIVGQLHGCGLRSDGVAECWGDNDDGRAPATRAAAGGTFVQLGAGNQHSCGLRSDGVAECWGSNTYGQAPPSRAASSGRFTQLVAGDDHTCALRDDGVVECWGWNTYEQAPPTRAASVGTFVQVSAGSYHTCALRDDGRAECWGYDVKYGQAPPERSATNGRFVEVDAGSFHTCAVTSLGAVECWGRNVDGESTPPALLVFQPAQAITFTSTPPAPAVIGGTYAVSATGGASGNPVTFSSLTAGVCTVSGGTVSLVAAGTCTVAADQAGNAAYGPAPQATQTFVVVRRSQAITFSPTPPASALLGGTLPLGATGGLSGNPVVFSSLTPGTCAVSGGAVTFAAVGPCTVAADQAGNASYDPAPRVTHTIAVVWPFTGFLAPVSNLPTVNTAKAGSAIPLKFALGGDRGLAVLAAGSPASQAVACQGGAPGALVEPTTAPGGSSLSYAAAAGQYTYVWKTEREWAGTCRRLTLTLADGTRHAADFQFTR